MYKEVLAKLKEHCPGYVTRKIYFPNKGIYGRNGFLERHRRFRDRKPNSELNVGLFEISLAESQR